MLLVGLSRRADSAPRGLGSLTSEWAFLRRFLTVTAQINIAPVARLQSSAGDYKPVCSNGKASCGMPVMPARPSLSRHTMLSLQALLLPRDPFETWLLASAAGFCDGLARVSLLEPPPARRSGMSVLIKNFNFKCNKLCKGRSDPVQVNFQNASLSRPSLPLWLLFSIMRVPR